MRFVQQRTDLLNYSYIGAQIDPLLEDGAKLEAVLKKAGVSVRRKAYTGTAREFFGMAATVKQAAIAQQEAGQALRASFGEAAVKQR